MSASTGAPLFCPFCRECFEGETECPEHELPLVPFEMLPKRKRVLREDERVVAWEPRYGRGIVAAGLLLQAVGFFLPMFTFARGEEITMSAFTMAATMAANLWAIPAAIVAIAITLARRRTLAEMRGARLAVPLLSALGGVSLAYTLYRTWHGAQQLAATDAEVGFAIEWGTWVVALGIVVAIAGGVVLGVVRRAEEPPDGATLADEGDDAIDLRH